MSENENKIISQSSGKPVDIDIPGTLDEAADKETLRSPEYSREQNAGIQGGKIDSVTKKIGGEVELILPEYVQQLVPGTEFSHIKKTPEELRDILLTMARIYGIDSQGGNPEAEMLAGLCCKFQELLEIYYRVLKNKWSFDAVELSKIYFRFITDPAVELTDRKQAYNKLIERIILNTKMMALRSLIEYSRMFYQYCTNAVSLIIGPEMLKIRNTVSLTGSLKLPDSKVKSYLLDLAKMLSPGLTPAMSEERHFSVLSTKMENNLKILRSLSDFPWCSDMPWVQKATLNYFMDVNGCKKDKRRVNNHITQRIEFNLFMNNTRNIIAEFIGFYKKHIEYIQAFSNVRPKESVHRFDREEED